MGKGKQPEHDLTIESRLQNFEGPHREDVAYEATLRIANSISSKYAHYASHYGMLKHVVGKPFVLAIAPFEEPHFWIQRLDGITNVLYACKLDRVQKENGTEIPLGFFLDDRMPEISAVIFSNVATYGKVVALANDKNSIRGFVRQHATDTRNSTSIFRITRRPFWMVYSFCIIPTHDFHWKQKASSSTALPKFTTTAFISLRTSRMVTCLNVAA